MPSMTTAAVLIGAGLLAQAAPESVNLACNSGFALTRPPLSTWLPSGVTEYANCIEISGWGDSARLVGTGANAVLVLDAFSVTLRGEGPEVMLFRQRQLTGQVLPGAVSLWQVSLVAPVGARNSVELSQVIVQSVTTSITADGYSTRILLQPRSATWRAWRLAEPGPGGTAAIIHAHNFTDP